MTDYTPTPTKNLSVPLTADQIAALTAAGARMNGFTAKQVAALLINPATIDAVVTKFERQFGPAASTPSSNGVASFDAARDS